MKLFSRAITGLRRLFGTTAVPAQDSGTKFEELVWLEREQTPFGVRVLDCRPLGRWFLSTTANPDAIRFFRSPAAMSGDVFRDAVPERAITVPCDLHFSRKEPLPEGPLILASVMEEKWNVYHFAGALYFVRSWNGELRYTARVTASDSGLHVSEVTALRDHLYGEGTLVLRQIDYLVRCYVLGEITPHPVPLFCLTKQTIALWSFSEYGRLGHFAEHFRD